MRVSDLATPTKTADPATTKVERLVESIEAFTLAIMAAKDRTVLGKRRPQLVADVKDAREECAKALHEFLAPMLRVVHHGE